MPERLKTSISTFVWRRRVRRSSFQVNTDNRQSQSKALFKKATVLRAAQDRDTGLPPEITKT
jgi:hypothetical protein